MKNIRKILVIMEILWFLYVVCLIMNDLSNIRKVDLFLAIFCIIFCIEYKIRKILNPDSPEVIERKKKEWSDMLDSHAKIGLMMMIFSLIMLLGAVILLVCGIL